MNDPFITSRLNANAAPAGTLLNRIRNARSPDDLMNTLYLTVLSRYPTDDEKKAILASFRLGDYGVVGENLLWSLYNKVDFVFNY